MENKPCECQKCGKKTDQLRPYGADKTFVCFVCAPDQSIWVYGADGKLV